MMRDDARRRRRPTHRLSRDEIEESTDRHASTNDAISRASRIHPSSPIHPSVVAVPPPHIRTTTHTTHIHTLRHHYPYSTHLHHEHPHTLFTTRPTLDRGVGHGAWDSLTNDESRPIMSPRSRTRDAHDALDRDRGGTSSDGHFDESRPVRGRRRGCATHPRPPSSPSLRRHILTRSWLPWR